MRTWRMIFNPKKQKDAVFCQYFLTNTTDARRMYNTANFYIRNTMTGIKKSPELRTSNEVMCIKDGKEKCISNVVAINLHTQKLIVKERKK